MTKKKKIGEILVENSLISKENLNKALEYQKNFGGGITQYLIAYGFLREEDLAKCISDQFGFPYLPLKVYQIPKEILKLIPVDIVKKFWLMPVDKVENILTVVMADPLDTEAIESVEKVTGLKVQQFVGIISDIMAAIEHYYKVVISVDKKKDRKTPLFIDSMVYKGFERRKAVRLNAKLDIHFSLQNAYKKSETKNISIQGLLFESDNILPVGSYLTLQVDLPKEFTPYPVVVICEVVRVKQLENKKFDIGARIVKVPEEDLAAIMKYARSKRED
mgnify:CR=1 FL=1